MFIPLKTLKSLTFSVYGINNTFLQHHTSKTSIMTFSAFNIVHVSAIYRATFHTKLFISAFLVSRLTMFMIKIFLFLYKASMILLAIIPWFYWIISFIPLLAFRCFCDCFILAYSIYLIKLYIFFKNCIVKK